MILALSVPAVTWSIPDAPFVMPIGTWCLPLGSWNLPAWAWSLPTRTWMLPVGSWRLPRMRPLICGVMPYLLMCRCVGNNTHELLHSICNMFFINAAIFEELESLLLLLLLEFFLCPFLVDFFLLTCFLFFSELCFPIVETKQTGQLLKSVYKINILMWCVEVWHTEIKM